MLQRHLYLNGNEVTLTNDKGQWSKQEIKHVLKDAEKYRGEDERHEQAISARNTLESYCLMMKWDMQYKLKDRLSALCRTAIMDRCDDVIHWVDANWPMWSWWSPIGCLPRWRIGECSSPI
jgi:L1 cell adhesion molecule like protein